ncbi:MAG: hypothetical protein JNM37_12000 [Rhodocyclaceae bacterium]|nr:hypothetical protein [Rhodocyclaceae bacterium]
MDPLENALQDALFANGIDAALPTHLGERARRAVAMLAEAESAHGTELATAHRDLLPEARARRIAEVERETDARIRQAIEEVRTELTDALATARQRLRGASPGPVDPAIEAEFRSALRGIDPVLVREHFLEACRVLDRRTIAAVIGAPFFLPLVDSEALEVGERIRARAAQPQVAELADALARALSLVDDAERATRRRLGLIDTLQTIMHKE